MNPSRSKYIEFESVPVSELCKREPGAQGLYIPKKDAEGSTKKSIAAISSAGKSYASRLQKGCVVQQVMLVERSLECEVPAPVCMLRLTITPGGQLTARGKRYREANKK